MVGRRSKVKVDENLAITPDKLGKQSPRSRKCLDMNTQNTKPTPLSEKNVEWSPKMDVTPQKSTASQLSAAADSPSLCMTPDLIPKTPSQRSSRKLDAVYTPMTPRRAGAMPCPLLFPTPKRKRTSCPVIPDKYKQPPPSVRKSMDAKPSPTLDANFAGISSVSFYKKAKPDDSVGIVSESQSVAEMKSRAPQNGRAKSEPRSLVRRTGSRYSGHRRFSRRSDGRKIEGLAGVSHGIKRPKKKAKLKSYKVSELPTSSIELPGSAKSKSATTTPRLTAIKPPKLARGTKTPTTPKTGSLTLTSDKSVEVEVRAGEITFRKSRSHGGTPLRRSPRKLSPMKESYFGLSRSRSRGGDKRLFSPQTDFLNPLESGLSPKKYIPSPVKFNDSTEDEDDHHGENQDIGDIIDNLEWEEGQGRPASNCLRMLATDEEMAIASSHLTEQPRPIDLDSLESVQQFVEGETSNAAQEAVQNILGNLSTDTDSMVSSSASEMETSGTENPGQDSYKFFPIFYKDQAQSGADHQMAAARKSGGSRRLTRGADQYQIDAGQKRGPTLCLVCGTVYTMGDPQDEADHEKAHSGVVEGLKFPGWKDERLCGELHNGRIIAVHPGDPKFMWRKVEDVLRIVDRDLGFAEVGIRAPEKSKAYLFVANKRIVGFLLAEALQEGFRLISKQNEKNDGTMHMISEDPQPIKCGVSRIWVLTDYRRKGIASSLVDSMRTNFVFGEHLREQDFAFSSPTLNGVDFASRYMDRADFLVYNR